MKGQLNESELIQKKGWNFFDICDILWGVMEPLVSNSNCCIGGAGEGDAVHWINLNSLGSSLPVPVSVHILGIISQ